MTPAPTPPPAGTMPYKLEQRHCIVAGEDDDHFTVWLIVGPQQFCLTQWALLKDEADHFEGMARTAMDRLVAAGEAAERKRAAEVARNMTPPGFYDYRYDIPEKIAIAIEAGGKRD